MSAWTWSDQFDLRREIDLLLDSLRDKGYAEIDQDMLMRILSSLVCNSINSDDLVDVAPETLVKGMETLKSSISMAVDFLEGQLKVKNIIFLPFPIMMIPIVNFYALIKKPTSIQMTQVRKWFWQCSLTLRYKAGTNRLVLEDLEKIKEISQGKQPFDDYHPSAKK
ncbi:hypothetical protein [Pantoea sp. Ae16]|uniref:hypothetical protein n=1 Tax=Pantoea sp. Ae16 TaxID=1890373 RepID=UPI001C31BBFE|nr:hypothetical protein [Pantoea sp. Ae16]